MLGRFVDKVVLITGAGSGIGAATAKQIAREGGKLAVVDMNGEAADRVAAELRRDGAEAIAITTDISKSSQVASMVATTVEHFGALHMAVNNAGVGISPNTIPDTDDAAWERVVSIHVNGNFYCLKHEIPAILRAGGGAIVNIASMYGFIGFPRYAAISATKHAIIGLTRSAALEFAEQGLRVNTLCPGVIATPLSISGSEHANQLAAMVPMKRVGTPEDVAQTACFLLSDAAAYINASEVQVDGGICH